MTGQVDRAKVGLLALSHAVDDTYQGAVPALLPFFIAERHYSYAAATGLMFAATALSSVIQPVFGALTDRRNLRWLVPVGLTLAGVGVGFSGLAASYPLTWLAIALSGIGVAAFHPEAARAARAASGDSQQAMSVFSVGGNFGLVLGPLFVTAVLGGTGIRGTVFLALPAVVTGAVVYLLLAQRAPALAKVGGRGGERAGAGDDWRGFSLLTSVVVVRAVLFFGLSSLLALYVGTSLGGGQGAGEAALTTLLAAGAVGTVVGGRLADRFGRLPVIRVSLAVAAVGLVAIVLTGLPWVFVAVAVTGFAQNLSFSLTVTLGQDYLPNRIGTSSGVTLGLAMSVGGLLAPALGALADATSLRLALVALLVIPPAALALALRLKDPRAAGAVVAPAVAHASGPRPGEPEGA